VNRPFNGESFPVVQMKKDLVAMQRC
jgi:hypothetical protein